MSLHGARTAGVAVLLATTLGATAARAQEQVATRPTARLVYAVDPAVSGCPDASALRQAVASRLGQDPFESDARAELRAAITRRGAGLVGRVSALDADGREVGSREVTARAGACHGLVEMLAVTATLAFEQPALRRPLAATTATPATPATPAPATPAPVAPALPPGLTPEEAVARVEAVLVEEASQRRRANTAAVIALGVFGAGLVGAGAYGVSDATGPTPVVGATLITVGACVGIAGALFLVFSDDPTEPLVRSIRERRAAGVDAAETLAHTEVAWEASAERQRVRRVRLGAAVLGTGAVLVASATIVLVAQQYTTDDRIAESVSVLLGAVGAASAFVGSRYLFMAGASEESWRVYRRLRAPVLRPLAAWTGDGAVLGVAGTF